MVPIWYHFILMQHKKIKLHRGKLPVKTRKKKKKKNRHTQKKEIKTKDLSEGNEKIMKNNFKESFTEIHCVCVCSF